MCVNEDNSLKRLLILLIEGGVQSNWLDHRSTSLLIRQCLFYAVEWLTGDICNLRPFV